MERFCPVDAVTEVIGNKGSLQILRMLFGGPKRTLELLKWIELSSKTLSDRLKELEGAGIISRKSYPESPPRVEYSLTAKGSELRNVLEAMREVGERWQLRFCDKVSPRVAGRICKTCTLYQPLTRVKSAAAAPSHATGQRRTDVTLL